MKERILLIDVDSKIPNLALMKISTYYKQKNYLVDFKRLKYSGYPSKKKKITIDASNYSFVFISTIFTVNEDVLCIIGCNDVVKGGTGYSLDIKLPDVIDSCEEDYSLYGECDTSYGFITRGCIRNCEFCFVPKKEGMIHKYRNVDDIVKHKKVIFMDNNILAFDKCVDIFKELINKNIKCQFNQGLDICLLDDKKA